MYTYIGTIFGQIFAEVSIQKTSIPAYIKFHTELIVQAVSIQYISIYLKLSFILSYSDFRRFEGLSLKPPVTRTEIFPLGFKTYRD
jgi:hypothetical protein